MFDVEISAVKSRKKLDIWLHYEYEILYLSKTKSYYDIKIVLWYQNNIMTSKWLLNDYYLVRDEWNQHRINVDSASIPLLFFTGYRLRRIACSFPALIIAFVLYKRIEHFFSIFRYFKEIVRDVSNYISLSKWWVTTSKECAIHYLLSLWWLLLLQAMHVKQC